MRLEVSGKFKEVWGSMPSFDDLMTLDGEMYRQVARRKTFKFQLNDKQFFAKIHRGVGWREIFKNLITARMPVLGASNEYEAINKLEEIGIDTMTLAAFGQRGSNVAELDSFVITESLEPAVSLEDLSENWASEKPSLELKRALIKRVATIVRQLHQNGINHRDLYICHFLLKEADMQGISDVNKLPLYLIDLHRVQIRSKIPERWLVKDIAALYFSSMGIGFTQRDLYRFVTEYSQQPLRETLKNQERFWLQVSRKAQQLWNKHG